MRFLNLLVLMSLPFFIAYPQESYILSGTVKDSLSGEDLIGATVYVSELETGTISNNYGFYSLNLPKGNYTLVFSYIGFRKESESIQLNKSIRINKSLVSVAENIEEVTILSGGGNKRISTPEFGVERLNLREIQDIPVLFGEKDIIKTLQLLPGISSSSEGSTGFNVRGGSMGQNLILLDEAPVYSTSHLMGFFSVFNSDALNDVTVYKGNIPARFGSRASSVVDISMKNGNIKQFSSSGGVGLISSRLVMEGPIVKDKMSFIVSGRRTYGDLIARLLFPETIIRKDMQFFFHDLNGKMNFVINDKNRIFLSGYYGKDVFELGNDVGTNWGNTTSSIRWNHLFSNRYFSNTTLLYSQFDYGFIFGLNHLRLKSGITNLTFKEDLSWYINPGNTLRYGVHITHHTFRPGELTLADSMDFEVALKQKQGIEGAIYLENEQKIGKRLSAGYGFRISGFSQAGPGTFYEYDEFNQVIDSTVFEQGSLAYPELFVEPRVSLNFIVGPSRSLKISYNRLTQYIHLLSNSTAGSPSDFWMPGSKHLKPLLVDYVAAGYYHDIPRKQIETSAEIYVKKIRNTSDYEDGADIVFDEHVESQILIGEGRSYGLELFLKKPAGIWSGWISYGLSRTENRIDGINDGDWYPLRYDRTHDFSAIVSRNLGQRWSITGVWVYSTGNAVTFPSGKYIVNETPVPYYTERNGYRMPSYHRMDLSLSLKGKEQKRFRSSWEFSVYNVYNRRNPYLVNFRESINNPGNTEAVKLSLFGIVPSIGYNFSF